MKPKLITSSDIFHPRWLAVAIVLLAIAVVLGWFEHNSDPSVSISAALIEADSHSNCSGENCVYARKLRTPADPVVMERAKNCADAFAAWLRQQSADGLSDEVVLGEGFVLAKARREGMKTLIAEDPDSALEHAISYAEYAALPPAIRDLLEEPFSINASLEVQITCGEGDSELSYVLESGRDQRWDVSMPTWQRVSLSKRNLPVQGIRLDDHAVVRSEVFQVLDGADARYVSAQWPAAQSKSDRCFRSGQPIEGEGITAVAGGLVFRFQDHKSLEEVETIMAKADERPGIDTGSSWLMAALAEESLDQFPEQIFAEKNMEAAEAATTTVRSAIFILVNFTDDLTNPNTNGELAGNLDVVDDALQRYSFGYTSLDATIIPQVFTMPQTKEYYGTTANGDNILYNDAINAYINDGTGNPDPRGIYDTVAVAFPRVTQWTFAGRASVGGQSLKLSGAISPTVILHELGHNYGLSHAGYWLSNSSNPVDPAGTSQEYGDSYDVMGAYVSVPYGHFSPGPKVKLNWIPSADWNDLVDTNDNGTYRVHRFDHEGSTGLRGLRIAKNATGDHYWVGYRRDFSSMDAMANGAWLTWELASNLGGVPAVNKSWLVDTKPGSVAGKADSPLSLGRTYSDAASNVHITTVAVGGVAPNEYLDVVVNFGDFPGNNAPSGTFSSSANVTTGVPATITAAATDMDGDALAYSWDIGDGLIKPNSSSLTYTWNQTGSHIIEVVVSDMKGGTLTLQQTITVSDPPNQPPVIDAGEAQTVVLSGPSVWTPAQISPVAWYDAADADSIVKSGDLVSVWRDKSGNGKDAVQATVANQPEIGIQTRNNLPLITPRNGAKFMSVTNGPQMRMGMAVVNVRSTAGGSILNVGSTSGSTHEFFVRKSSAQLSFDGGGTTTGKYSKNGAAFSGLSKDHTVTSDGAHVWSGVFSSSNTLNFIINRDNLASGTDGPDVGEILWFGSELSATDRQKVEGYLAHKWGTHGSLVSGHPFRTKAPGRSVVANLDGTVTDAEDTPTSNWILVSGPASVSIANASAVDTTVTFTTPGTYVFRLTANDGANAAVSDEVTITVNAPYDNWADGTFSEASSTTGMSGDPDGDAFNNLQEFAFGMDPTAPGGGGLAFETGYNVTRTGAPILMNFAAEGQPAEYRAVFLRRKDRLNVGLVYTVQFSADLAQWTKSFITPTVLTGPASAGDMEAVSVPYPTSVPANGGTQQLPPKFFRIGVDTP